MAKITIGPSDTMYLKQGEHLMKKGVYGPALVYINQALIMNPDSKVIFNEEL